MKFKQLAKSDLQLLNALSQANPPKKGVFIYPDIDELNFVFNNSSCKAYGLFDKNQLIGWGGYLTGYKDYSLKKGFYEVNAIYLDKKFKGKGLGEKILKKIIKELKANEKYKKIFLTVSPLNSDALLLYLKNNFIVFDFKNDYYGKGEDRLFLSFVEA